MRENMLSLARINDGMGSNGSSKTTKERTAQSAWICGVLKDSSYASFSPDMHNQGYAASGLSNFTYNEYSITPYEFGAQMEEFKNPNNRFRGISVGKPFKEAVMETDNNGAFVHLNELDDSARLIGAVNTITIERRDNVPYLKGTNTDYIGFVEAVKEKGGDFTDKTVMVFGAGGAARASIYGALQEGASHIQLVARNTKGESKDKVEKLKKDFEKQGVEISVIDLDDLNPQVMESADIIVGATGSERVIPIDGLLPKHTLVEWAYSKGKDKTELEALADGKVERVVNGRSILIYQAVGQFELFTEKPAPVDVFKNTIEKATA